jgi:hypothetical protein
MKKTKQEKRIPEENNNINEEPEESVESDREDYRKLKTEMKKKTNIGETLTGLLSRKMSKFIFNKRKGTHFGEK